MNEKVKNLKTAILALIPDKATFAIEMLMSTFPVLKCQVEGHQKLDAKGAWIHGGGNPRALLCSRCHLVYWE